MTETDKALLEKAKAWDLPRVDDMNAALDMQTNALNRPRGQWKYEAPDEDKDVKPLTAQEIEAIRDSAYQEGLANGHKEGFEKGQAEGLSQGIEEGKEQGHKEGLETGQLEAKTQIDEQLGIMQSLIEQIHTPLAQINEEVKKELILLAVNLAKAVINVEIQQNEQVLLNAIEAGLKALPTQESTYHIELHPSDIELVQQHFSSQTIAENNWQIVENGELKRGGCKILTNNNAVDVSIAKRCENIFTPLLLNQGLNDDPRAS